MKNIFYTILAAMLLLAACEPIEDRQELGAGITADDLQLKVYGASEGSNKVIVENNTPGIGGTWDLILEKSFKQIDTILIPFLGVNTFTFTATTDEGLVEKSIDYEVTKMDYPLDPAWTIFAGSTKAGKTWVWAFDNPNCASTGPWGNGAYLSDRYPSWWGPSPDGSSGYDGTQNDEMIFDLNNAANYTLVTHNTGSAGMAAGTYVGEFKFSFFEIKQKEHVSDGTLWALGELTLSGGDKPTLSRGFSPNESNKKITKFDIVILQDNELVLAYPEKNAEAWGTAWYWVLKPKGYNY